MAEPPIMRGRARKRRSTARATARGIRVGLDERADHGAVDDRDEVAQRRVVAVVAAAGEDLAEEGVELDPHRAHERGEVGPPPGADELLVAQEHGVEAAVAGLDAQQLVEEQLDQLGVVDGRRRARPAVRRPSARPSRPWRSTAAVTSSSSEAK